MPTFPEVEFTYITPETFNSCLPLCFLISKTAFGGDVISNHPDRENIIKKIAKGKGMLGKKHKIESKIKMSQDQKKKLKKLVKP